MRLAIEETQFRTLGPITNMRESSLDLFIGNKTGMIIDHFPPFTFHAKAHASFEIDHKIHTIAIMLGARRGENFGAFKIELLDREGSVDIGKFLF